METLDILAKVAATLLAAFIVYIVGFLAGKYKNLAKKQNAIECGLIAILRDRISQMYYYYMEKGYISQHSLESLNSMYKAYKSLGGNGTADKLYNELIHLPIGDSSNKK